VALLWKFPRLASTRLARGALPRTTMAPRNRVLRWKTWYSRGEESVTVGLSGLSVLSGLFWARAGLKEIAGIRTRMSCNFAFGVRMAVCGAVTNGRIQQTAATATLKPAG
jgi:hypothetical protein